MKSLLFISLIATLTSCAVSKTKLTDEGKEVKIIASHNDRCDVLGKVVGFNEEGIEKLAQNHARNLAGDLGGDSVLIEMVNNGDNMKAIGTVYQCD